MMHKVHQIVLQVVCLLFSLPLLSQIVGDSTNIYDDRYLEDQFYIGVGYNFLIHTPDAMDRRNLSYNLQVGFIKDIPLNKRRNFGIGLGLGYAVNSYYSNLVATEQNNSVGYQIMEDSNFNRSKLGTHALEVPFEIRWRTSTAEEYKFWRVYAGAKLGYLFSTRSKLVTNDGNNVFTNDDIEKFQYGLMLGVGYNTWNVRVYYGLSPILKERAVLNGEPLDFKVLRVGLIFYIL